MELIISSRRPSFGIDLPELWRYRELFWTLAWRNILVHYKQTVIGIAWALIRPILTMIVFSVIFGRIAGLSSNGVPYPLLVFAAVLPWQFFANSLTSSSESVVSHASMITKVYFPRLVIPLAGALSALVDFAVALVLMVALLAAHGAWAGPWLALLPVVLIVNLALAVGLGLWISALNVRYRDFMYALPFLLQVWMYASPVVYGLSLVPERWQGWFILNPMCGVLEGFRQTFLGASGLTIPAIITTLSAAVLTLTSGAVYFRSVEQEFAERL